MPSGACGSVRPLVTRGGALLRTAGLAAVVLAAAAAPAANASADSAAAPRVELRGTVSPLVAQGLAHVVGTPSAAKQVQAVVAFKPRNAILLHWLAERSTGRPGMSNAEIQRLFAPRPATVAAVRSYLSANGLSVVDSTDMSLVVSGTAAAADQAFGVGLRTYTDARGITYQAPSRNVRLPKGIASVVQSVAGLDSSLKLHPHYQVAKHVRPTAAAARCGIVPSLRDRLQPRRTQATNADGGLPADRTSQPTVYDHDALVSGGTRRHGPDRSGSSSSRTTTRPDSLHFKNCFNRASPAASRPTRPVGGGPSDSRRPGRGQPRHRGRNGRGAGRQLTVYKAAEQPGAPADDARTRCAPTNVDVVSDSWGLCELFVPVKLTADENIALELLAVSRRLVLRRLGRRRRRRLPRGEPGREVPRDRRSVGPAVRDGRRRDESSDAPVRRASRRRGRAPAAGSRSTGPSRATSAAAARPTCRADSARAGRPSAA